MLDDSMFHKAEGSVTNRRVYVSPLKTGCTRKNLMIKEPVFNSDRRSLHWPAAWPKHVILCSFTSKAARRDRIMAIEPGKVKRQEIKMLNRKLLEVSGVMNVESFDSEEFLLETEFGYLMIKGQNLHIKNLSLEQGLVAIEGLVNELAYLDTNSQGKPKGFFGKLFK